jgi:hypothetical protein
MTSLDRDHKVFVLTLAKNANGSRDVVMRVDALLRKYDLVSGVMRLPWRRSRRMAAPAGLRSRTGQVRWLTARHLLKVDGTRYSAAHMFHQTTHHGRDISHFAIYFASKRE